MLLVGAYTPLIPAQAGIQHRHCEERSDEAIQAASTPSQTALDCFAALAMTVLGPRLRGDEWK